MIFTFISFFFILFIFFKARVLLDVSLMIVRLKSREPTFGHGPSPAQVDISTHLFAYVYTASHDGLESQFVNALIILSPD